MNIGIVVYSETGNTLALCERARDLFAADGHDVTLARITADVSGGVRTLRDAPDASACDLVLLGTPVQAFSLPLPVRQYLLDATFREGVRFGILVTQFFKADWLGGTRTVKQAAALVARCHPLFYGSAIVHVRSRRRNDQINAAMRTLTNLEGKF